MKGSGNHIIGYRSTDRLGNNETVRWLNVSVDDDPPITHLSAGEPRIGSDPLYVTSSTQFNFSVTDSGVGTEMIYYRLVDNDNDVYDDDPWLNYSGNFSVNGSGDISIYYYSTDILGNNETLRSCRIFVDDEGPVVWAFPGNNSTRRIEIEAGGTIELFSNDTGVGGETIYYDLDGGDVWYEYEEPIIIRNDTIIEYYAVDALGNRGADEMLTVAIIWNGTLPADDEDEKEDDDILFSVLVVCVVAVILIVLLILYARKREVLRKILGFEEKREEPVDAEAEVSENEVGEVATVDVEPEMNEPEKVEMGTEAGNEVGTEEVIGASEQREDEAEEGEGDRPEGEGSMDREGMEDGSLE